MLTEEVNLYINRYGYIFPSCKTYKDKPIAHLSDKSPVSLVFGHFGKIIQCNSVTVEFSSLCHANCFYCFQHDGVYKKYPYFEELTAFLNSIETKYLFVSGGEILDQPDTMFYLTKLKSNLPKAIFHLKSNGNADLDKIDFIEKTFDEVVISFNGFSSSTCKLIMGNNVDIEKTKRFVITLVKNGIVSVGIKYLLSPIVISEMNDFFDWALNLAPRCIIVQMAYQYKLLESGLSLRQGTTFDNCKDDYWQNVLSIISKDLIKTLSRYSINNGINNSLAADRETAELLKWGDEINKLFRMDGVYDLEKKK